MILLVLLLEVAPPVDTTGFSPEQRFWFAVLTTIVPVVLGLLTLAGTALAVWQARQAAQQSRQAAEKVDANTEITTATQKELGLVHGKVDGQGEELRSLTGRAAHAEGKLEGFAEASVAPVVPPVQVVVDPDAIVGGRRRLDPPATSPSAEVDPSSHSS